MVDVDEVSIPAGIVVNNLAFGEAKGFLSLASSDYNLQLKTQEGIGAAEFIVPLSAFSDSVLFVAATGYLDTTGATPNNPFKLLAVTPSGIVVELNPEASLTPARIQLIHNCAVPATDFVDVYLDDEKILDNFEFRTATSFIEVPGATEFIVDIDNDAPEVIRVYNERGNLNMPIPTNQYEEKILLKLRELPREKKLEVSDIQPTIYKLNLQIWFFNVK